jgi:hypothetical protein
MRGFYAFIFTMFTDHYTLESADSILDIINASYAGDPPGSRQVYDSFTTKNHSRWISFNFVRDTFTSCSRLVRDSFTTYFYSRLVRILSVDHLQRHVITSRLVRDTFTTAVVNESRTSRKLVWNPVDHPHYCQ